MQALLDCIRTVCSNRIKFTMKLHVLTRLARVNKWKQGAIWHGLIHEHKLPDQPLSSPDLV